MKRYIILTFGLMGAAMAAELAEASKDSSTPASQLTNKDQEALELGRMVTAARLAIANPSKQGSLAAVKKLGADTRYYVLVRGWLRQQHEADCSIRQANGKDTPQAILDRIGFLEKCLRAIDLEH